ncbi:MAG: hypothetical protein ACYDAO_04230 [Thermoplasmataceae archaeon]
MAKNKIMPTSNDIRTVLKDIYREQMIDAIKKQEKAKREKELKGAFGGNCPYCSKFVVLNDKDVGRSKIVEENEIKHIEEPCPFCQKPIRVDLILRSAEGFGGEPTVVGVLSPIEEVPEVPEKPSIKVESKQPTPTPPSHTEIMENAMEYKIKPKPKKGLTPENIEQLKREFPARKKELILK